MRVFQTADGDLCINVPFHIGYSMLWDAFKCELHSLRLYTRSNPFRRASVQKARTIAKLMISLLGRPLAFQVLRSIARYVALEVRP